jgi:autophagy-related protein 16
MGPSWQEELRQRLIQRNEREAAYAGIIDQCSSFSSSLVQQFVSGAYADRRLAQQTKLLKERNASLLTAVGSVRSNPNASTVLVSTGDDE